MEPFPPGARVRYNDASPLEFSFRLSGSSFEVGEEITMELAVKNLSEDSSRFWYGACFPFEFAVYGDTSLVWNWGYRFTCVAILRSIAFAPREEKTFRVEWDQVGNNDETIDIGSYRVEATFLDRKATPLSFSTREATPPRLSFWQLRKSLNQGLVHSANLVISSQGELDALWDSLAAAPRKAVSFYLTKPSVDFSRFTVLAVFLGETLSQDIKIQEVTEASDHVEVRVLKPIVFRIDQP